MVTDSQAYRLRVRSSLVAVVEEEAVEAAVVVVRCVVHAMLVRQLDPQFITLHQRQDAHVRPGTRTLSRGLTATGASRRHRRVGLNKKSAG